MSMKFSFVVLALAAMAAATWITSMELTPVREHVTVYDTTADLPFRARALCDRQFIEQVNRDFWSSPGYHNLASMLEVMCRGKRR